MTGDTPSEPFGYPNGPYVAAAFWCEQLLEEKDGVLSAIRIVDRITTSIGGVGTPAAMPQARIRLALLVMLKSGAARGRHQVRLEIEEPNGMRKPFGPEVSAQLEGDERGHNLIFRTEMTLRLEGLYWVTVIVEGRSVSRVPLRIIYDRQELGPGG